MIGLSIVIPVKNEADKIELCLEHAKWAHEIIIIDNGSTDDTLKICRKYTKKIHQCLGKESDCIPHLQNFGISKATKDWILVLDADVIVPEKAKKEILAKIENNKYVGYYVPHRTVAFNKKLKCALFCDILKLFRRGEARFDENSEHPTLKIRGRIGKLKSYVLHYAHPDIETFVKKTNLYTSRDAKKIVQFGKGGLLNKKIKMSTTYNLLIGPFLYANYLFWKKRYYKDGMHGLIISSLMGFYLFLERAKVWEEKFRKNAEKQV